MVAPVGSRHRLSPGARTIRRAAGMLQVGLHHDRRVLLPDGPAERELLRRLRYGVDPATLPPAQQRLFARLEGAALLDPVDEHDRRSRVRAAARVGLEAPEPVRTAARGMLAGAGLSEAARGGLGTVRLLVTIGAEPRRERLDDAVRADRAHLLLTEVAGRARIGPFVVPGLTACVRCIDEHLTDLDPRHPLVVAQHLEPDPDDRAPEADRQLALAWAVRDLVTLVEGERPISWSATVELHAAGPVTRAWSRHPRCGCAWDELLAG